MNVIPLLNYLQNKDEKPKYCQFFFSDEVENFSSQSSPEVLSDELKFSVCSGTQGLLCIEAKME